MTHYNDKLQGKTALVTGASRRIGAEIARGLHTAGMNVVIHYRATAAEADNLVAELNTRRPASAVTAQADLCELSEIEQLALTAKSAWGDLFLLVNNASAYFPTRIGGTTEQQWNELVASNLKAPFFLIQELLYALKAAQGCVVNIVDVHAERPTPQHAVYCAAKAGLITLTRALARDLGPEIRVNGVAPGTILWPEIEPDDSVKRRIIQRIPLERRGQPSDVADAVLFLSASDYVTGEIIHVDGGYSLT